MSRIGGGARWTAVIIAVLAIAASGSFSACGGDASVDVCEPKVQLRRLLIGPPTLALLFVVDNSESMAEEQNALAEELPEMLRALVTGDVDGDGEEDFLPVQRIRLGVISADMGTAGFDHPSCAASDFGDDGTVGTVADPPAPGCEETYPSFLRYPLPDEGDVDSLGADLACMARLGTSGCDLAQPLEAALKAVSSSRSPLGFHANTEGHGDGPNADFLALPVLTAVVTLTDGDDCSVLDPVLHDPESTIYTGEVAARCHLYPRALHPIERYVEGFIDSRGGRSVYAPIVGVPERLLGEPSTVDYQAILDDPAMQQRVDPSDPTNLVPSCESRAMGRAAPPRRQVELARRLDVEGDVEVVLQSICAEDLRAPLREITRRIGWAVFSDCLRWRLSRDGGGFVDCELYEALPLGGRCDEVPGRTKVRAEMAGGEAHEVCRVEQRPVLGGVVPTAAGWYYDDFSDRALYECEAAPQRVAYAVGVPQTPGSSLMLECATTARSDAWSIGSPCPAPGMGCAAREVVDGRRCDQDLDCDPESNTLQVFCESDADCDWPLVCGASGRCTSEDCRG